MRLTRQRTSKRLQARTRGGRYVRPSLGVHVCACGTLVVPTYVERGAFVERVLPACHVCGEHESTQPDGAGPAEEEGQP